LQERAKEAEEAASHQVQQQPNEEECTIRTNAPPRLFGSVSNDDMCGQCSRNSKEALERIGGGGGASQQSKFLLIHWQLLLQFANKNIVNKIYFTMDPFRKFL